MNKQDNITLLFEYLRNHEWDKFIKLVDLSDTDESINLNASDNQGNYLLTYAVRFNKYDIVKKLIDKNIKLDIVDKLERSILYYAIEANFYKIVELLVETSKNTIGIMITDIRDINGNIPLHYAIKYKNKEIVEFLIKNNSNPYVIDNNGYNSLHLAVISGVLDIVKVIVNNISSLDSKTNKGETALHISINYKHDVISKYLIDKSANINIPDGENEFTPLHYAVGWDNYDIVEYLLKKGADPNIQDMYGNFPLMYCVKEDHIQSYDMFIKYAPIAGYRLNLNQWNIEGKLILHEVLENYNELKKVYLETLIEDTNLTIQDNTGNTCLHYLVSLNLWKNYKDILKKKKLNIFFKNSEGKAVIDLIQDKSDYDDFINIIVESYMYYLRKEKKDWPSELEKVCSRQFSELTKSDLEFISEKNENDFTSKCSKLIKNKLINDIEKYKKGEISHCQRSYPMSVSQCVTIDGGPAVNLCTFTGSLLDILIGLLFLVRKHNNACAVLGKSHIPNNDLCNFYRSMGLIMNGRCEFINFEIVWAGYKLHMIHNFTEYFNNCIVSKARFIIIPLGIEMKTESHANYLIYDKSIKELERFEPHGGTTPIGFNYNSLLLDDVLTDYFKSIVPDIKYIGPNKYIPKIGFQILDSQEDKMKKIGDPHGFCALWSIWYVDQRLTYHSYPRDKLVKILFTNIKSQGISYRNMIRNYSRNIISDRDKLLEKVGLDINDWLNDNYTNNQLDKFIGILLQEIKTCCVP